MKAKKKLLSLLLAAAMIVSLLPTAAFATEGDELPEEPIVSEETVVEEAERSLEAEPRAASDAPTLEQLTAMGYKFVSDYPITFKGTGTANLVLNGVAVTMNPGEQKNVNILESIYPIHATVGGTEETTIRRLMIWALSQPKFVMHLISSTKTTGAPNFNGMEAPPYVAGALQVEIPQSLNDLHVDDNGKIYFNFVNKTSSADAALADRKVYLGPKGFTTDPDEAGPVVPEERTDVYLNGTTGSDGKDGTTEVNAVATLQKALELVSAGGTIHMVGDTLVTGTGSAQIIGLSKDVTLTLKQGTTLTFGEIGANAAALLVNSGFTVTIVGEGTGATIKSAATSDQGILMRAAGTLTVKNITIDGSGFSNTVNYPTVFSGLGSGHLVLDKVTIQNINIARTGTYGNIIHTNSPTTYELKGCLIKDNTLPSEGQVIVTPMGETAATLIIGASDDGTATRIINNAVGNTGAISARGTGLTFQISGNSVIYDNKYNNKQFNIGLTDNLAIEVTAPMGASSKIGVTPATMPTSGNPVEIAHGTGAMASAAYFVSDTPTDAGVVAKDSKLWLDYDAREGIERTMNITLSNATSVPAVPSLGSKVDNGASVSYAITAVANYELPATVATSGGLTYTRNSGDATKATISGKVTGDVTMAVTATLKKYDVKITAGTGMGGTNLSQSNIAHGSAITKIVLTPDASYVLPNDATVNSGVLSGTGLTYAKQANGTAEITGTVTKAVTATIPNATLVTVTPGLTDSGAATLVVNPSDPNMEYAVIVTGTPGTPVNDGGWIVGNNGKLTLTVPAASITGTLQVVARPKDDGSTGTNLGDAMGYYYVANADATEGHNVAGVDSNAGTKAAPLLNISTAYGKIAAGKTGVIVVLDDIGSQAGFVANGKNVILTGETAGNRHAATFSSLGTSGHAYNIITISGNTFTVKNLILKNTVEVNQRMFELEGAGNLVLGSGAKVQASAAASGGAVAHVVAASTGTITMEPGAELSGNTGLSVIWTQGANSTFYMKGGTITGNTITKGNYAPYFSGAVDADGGKVVLSGDAVINGNATVEGTAANVYLKTGQKLQISGALTAPAGSIGIWVQDMPDAEGEKTEVAVPKDSYTITSGDSQVFFSDKATDAGILLESGKVWLSYDARTTVNPGVAPDGQGIVTIDPKEGTDYGILVGDPATAKKDVVVTDNNGKVVPNQPDGKGWITFPTGDPDFEGPFTVKPLPTGEEVSVVTRPRPTTPSPTDPGPETVDPVAIVTIPTTGGNLTSVIKPKNPGPGDDAFIVVNPSSPDLTYIVTDPDTGKAVVVTPGDPSGKTEIGPLTPGKDYVITTKPKTPTADPAPGAIINPGTAPYSPGVSVTMPKGSPDPIQPINPGGVGREEITTGPNSGKDKITINPTTTGQEYLVIDPETGLPVGGSPKTSTGGALTFEPLDPNKEYTVITRNPGTPPSLPLPGITVPGSHTVDPDGVKPGVTDEGKSTITLSAPTDPNTKYAIVDPATGKVVAPLTGGDKDGWQTGDPSKDLVFAPVTPGTDYVVVTMPKDNGDTDAAGGGGNEPSVPGSPDPAKPYPSIFDPKQPVGPVVTVPDVTEDQLTGKIVPGGTDPVIPDTATITVKPTDSDLIYAVVDENGDVVGGAGGWQTGTGKGGDALVFPGLEPGKDYKVVTMTKPGEGVTPPPTVDPDKGTLITTPDPDVVATIDPEDIGREHITTPGDPNEGKDKITVPNPGGGYEIAIIDPTTGKVVTVTGGDGGWIPGTDPAGTGSLTFAPLDSNKEYEVVIRPTTPEGSIRVPATPGISVPKVGDVTLSGVVKDKDNKPVVGATVKMTVATPDGGYQTLKATTDKDGKYVLEPNSNIAPGDYAIYVDSGEGVKTQNVTVTQKAEQAIGDIVVAKNADAAKNTNIIGGAVSNFGKPVAGQTVTVIDKQTGATVTPGAGSANPTTAGGGYTLENLPDGTYFVQTSGNGNSGLTEIKVEGGKIIPNTDGGYKSTNISTTKGGIIDGKVEGLAKGEKATVSVTVPIYGEDGDVIGAKTVTAVAEGEGGYWKIPGVPDGKYPVTVTTPKGTLTGELTVTDGKAASVKPTAPATGTDLKVEGGKLVVKAPAAVDPEKKPGTIVGVAVDKDGKPAKGATVNIYDEKGEPVKDKDGNVITTTTGEGGGYTVTGLPNGNYYISVDDGGKNGLTGPVKVTGSKTEGKTNVTTSEGNSKLLEGKVTLEGGIAPAPGATVVVKDSGGNIIATTKTDSNGQYFVGSVPAGAIVNIVTADKKEEVKFTVSGNGAAWNGDKTTIKVGDDTLTVVGPDGSVLPVQPGEATDNKTAQIIVTQGDPAVDKTGEFDVTDSKLVVKPGTPDGTYTVTVKTDNGMEVKKDITVASGKIVSGAPFAITTAAITGKVTYAVGSVPSDATISIPGFGSAKVNTNTGEYKFTGVPDGVYTATIVVKDKDGTDTTVTVTLTVKDGKAEYSNPGAGAVVGEPKTNLTISPTAPVVEVNTKIADAKAAIDTAKTEPVDPAKVTTAIGKVKDALDKIGALTDEGRKQLDPKAVKDLSDALAGLLTDLSVTATVDADATGVVNTGDVKGALEGQKNLLVDEQEMTTAATVGKEVDVSLTLKAKDATNDPTPAVQKDMSKVQALATAKNAEKVGYYDVTVEKTTVVKESDKPVSTTTVTVPELPTPVELKLSIPAELLGYQYYGVVRVHLNGKAERIPSTSDGTTVTFKSALYSTFAILASNDPIFEDDAKVPTGGSEGTGGGGSTGSGTGVTTPKRPGGSITVSPINPGKGEDFIITVDPDEGYVLDKLTVKDPKGNELTVTPMGGGKYKVTMPDPAVKLTVDATFKKLSNDPNANGVADLLNVDDHIAYMKGREGGVFAPTDNMTRAEVAQMFYNLLKTKDTDLGNKASYNDVPANAWYAKAVNTLANIGIVNGVGKGNFAPNANITRAEFIAIAARFADVATGGDTFSDVPATHWAYDEITTATAYGWISGYGDGTFKPGANIARSEAVKVVNAMLARSADKSFVDAAKELVTFPDVPKTDWAYYPIMEATNAHDFALKDGSETWKSK